MSDLLVLRSDGLSAGINPLGAELWSLTDRDGRQLMTDADPAWWTGHAPILFPIVGRLNGDRYRLGETHYSMQQHGFARRRPFVLMERSDSFVILRLESDDETRALYPFDFRLDMVFALTGATLAMTATVTNRGRDEMPFSFGYHPAFAWPLPYGAVLGDHRVIFDKAEPAPIRQLLADGTVASSNRASPVAGHILAPTHKMFEADALIWDRLESRSMVWGAPGTPGLRIDFPDTPWLGIWQKPGAHYLCIEPWAGMADPEGFDGDFRDKPGIVRILPGEDRHYRMTVTLTDAGS